MDKKHNIDSIFEFSNFEDILCFSLLFPQNSIINLMLKNNDLFSVVLFGLAGSGKSFAVSLILKKLNRPYFYFNPSVHNKKHLVDFLNSQDFTKTKPIIVIDEIHRFNKDKQDLLLLYLEKQQIIVLATTTENPYFKINPAILSRMIVYQMPLIDLSALKTNYFAYIKNYVDWTEDIVELIINYTQADFRKLVFLTKKLIQYFPNETNYKQLKQCLINLSGKNQIYNSKQNYYDLLSAFHKSMRGSDVNASLYYLGCLIKANELDGIYRRIMCVVYEDISLANSSLAIKAHSAIEASKCLGLPEAKLPLSSIVSEIALSPKSNSTYVAYTKVEAELEKAQLLPPNHIKDNHYYYAKKLGVKNYLYPHDYPHNYINQQYLPDAIRNKVFYEPNLMHKNEKKLAEYNNWLKTSLDKKNQSKQ